MTVSTKLKVIADLVEECENNFNYYSEQSKSDANSEYFTEYYAYKAELYKAMREAVLSKASKL